MKKIVLFATLVSFSIRWSNGQDTTPEQVAEEKAAADFMALQQKLASERALLFQKTLSPEDIAVRSRIREKISQIPSPLDIAKLARSKLAASSITTDTLIAQPALTRGDYMAMRMALVKKLLIESDDHAMANSFNKLLAQDDSVALGLFTQQGSLNLRYLFTGDTNITMYSITSSDYYPYNTGAFNDGSWTTVNNPTTDYPWITTARTLVLTNGPAARSATGMGINSRSVLATTLYNHYDYWGDEAQAHFLGLWYKLLNKISDDYSRIRLNQGIFWFSELAPATAWTHFETDIATIPKATTSLEFSVITYKGFSSGSTVQTQLDPSVRWIPYTFYPLNEDFAIEKVGNQVWVQWNTAIYGTSHWTLAFATTVNSQVWSTSIGVPVTIANGVATAKFPYTATQRYYRLIHN